MKMSRRKRSFSIILVPSGGSKPKSFSVSGKHMLVAVTAAILIIVLVVLSIAALGRSGRFSITIARLKSENKRLSEEGQKVARLQDELDHLRAIEGKLTTLLGVDKKNSDQKATLGSRRMTGQGFTQQGVSFGKTPTLWPVRGEISRSFSNDPGGHKGIDIAVPRETPVRASGDGVVEFAGEDEVFGNMVIISHGPGISTLYGHNSKLTVVRGDYVKKGQLIAYSGNSGNSSAPHLHFEISRNGRQVDPLTFLSEQ